MKITYLNQRLQRGRYLVNQLVLDERRRVFQEKMFDGSHREIFNKDIKALFRLFYKLYDKNKLQW